VPFAKSRWTVPKKWEWGLFLQLRFLPKVNGEKPLLKKKADKIKFYRQNPVPKTKKPEIVPASLP